MSHTAVVILNFNGEKFLKQFLPGVIRHSGSAEIIVADNASTDGSVALLQSFPQVRVIRLSQNWGFCGGYNRALEQVKADYYVLLNSDVEVTDGWLAPLIRILDTNPAAAAVQPKVLSWHRRDEFEYAGAGGGLIDSFGYPYCRGRVLSTVEKDHGQYDDETEIFWATGACLVIRSELYHRMGGLDEEFFAHMEEIDLCWKLQRAGFHIFYSGRSTVYHVGAGTLGYQSATKTYLNFRNGLAMITKHFDPWEIILKLPVRIGLDWAAAMMFLLRSEAPHAGAVLNAHGFYLRTFRHTWRKRTELRSRYPAYPRRTVYPGLIILATSLGRKPAPTSLKAQ